MADNSKTEGKVIDVTARVEVTATEKHPYRKAGVVFKIAPEVAKKLKGKGWVK